MLPKKRFAAELADGEPSEEIRRLSVMQDDPKWL